MIYLDERGIGAFSMRGVSAKIKNSYRHALRRHRAEYMHRHFKMTAKNHYGSDVFPAKRRTADTKRSRRRKAKPATTKKRTRQSNSADKRGIIPLVKTGLLRHKVLHGGYKIVGNQKQMRMSFIGVPKYTYFNNPGQINKVMALQAVAKDEEKAFADRVEKRIHKLITGGK